MPDPLEILKALNILVDQYGEDVDHYVKFDRFLNSESMVEKIRPLYENYISEKFIPGFCFENNFHAAWFMKNCVSWPALVTNYPMKTEFYYDNWIRMFFVPDKYHYRSELAAALQMYDRNTKNLIREFDEIRTNGDENEIRIATQKMEVYRNLRGLPPGPLKGERDLMSMKSWPHRLAELYSDSNLPKNDTSIMRLARKAPDYREIRNETSPPSGWHITQVSFTGELPNPGAEDQEKWEKFTKGYFERWKWHKTKGATTPEKTELTFREPASLELWVRAWTKNKVKFFK